MAITKSRQKEEQRLAKGMSHSLRARALEVFNERTASTNEVAKQLGVDVRKLAYHVIKLRDLKLIEKVDDRPVRGAIETFYRAVERPLVSADDWDAIPLERRPGLMGAFFQAILDQGVLAIEAGVVGNDSKFWVGPTPVKGDEQALEELIEIHNEAYEKTLQVESDYAERRRNGQAGDEVGLVSALACFRAAPPKKN